jgi:hypothetical protein
LGPYTKLRKKKFYKISLIFLILLGLAKTINLIVAEWTNTKLAQQVLESKVWSPQFLAKNPKIASKLENFENGRLCYRLKNLNNFTLPYVQIIQTLKDSGYTCFVKPLTVNPDATPVKFLKKDGTECTNPHEQGVAFQEVCVERKEGCVVRLKIDGFPGTKRPQPHSTKAVLLDTKGDPSSYANEAFKITYTGKPIPKGPTSEAGLSHCPYPDQARCNRWVDAIMAAAHPDLKGPASISHDKHAER